MHSGNVAGIGLHCFFRSLHVFQVPISLDSIPIRIMGTHYTLMAVHCDIMADQVTKLYIYPKSIHNVMW